MLATSRRRTLRAVALAAAPLTLASALVVSDAWRWWWNGDHASAVLRAADANRVGSVRFREHGDGTRVTVRLDAGSGRLASGFHGIHVHANSDPANGDGCVADPSRPPAEWFVSADGHLGNFGSTHPGHSGDLPSVLIDDHGRAAMQFTTHLVAVDDLDGTVVILHARPDNFGNVPVGSSADTYTPNGPEALEKTAKTGNAGDRVACGEIDRD